MSELTREHIFSLIMAGGRGTRLWPLTTAARPKAFLSFDGTGISLLQRTISRMSRLMPLDNIFIVSGRSHETELRAHVRDIPQQNIILEPVGRSTLPCVGLAGLYIRRRDDSSVMVVVPGEQLIQDEDRFRSLIMCAAEAARSYNSVVTLGIKPTTPTTRFGYIRLGDEVPCVGDIPVFRSRGFAEKPDQQKVSEFLSSGEYLWNSGIFIWPTSLMFDMISRYAPDVYTALTAVDDAIGTLTEEETVQRAYSDMPGISIDYAIMEKAEGTLIIPADIGWNDMGTWPEVAETWEKDDESNARSGQHVRHVGIDSSGCVIYSQSKLIATVGVRDMIIIETPGVLLLCDKARASDVKKLVQKLEEGVQEREKERYL